MSIAREKWSGWRGSNPSFQRWQRCVLPLDDSRGAGGGTRTPNLHVRSVVHSPVVLRQRSGRRELHPRLEVGSLGSWLLDDTRKVSCEIRRYLLISSDLFSCQRARSGDRGWSRTSGTKFWRLHQYHYLAALGWMTGLEPAISSSTDCPRTTLRSPTIEPVFRKSPCSLIMNRAIS